MFLHVFDDGSIIFVSEREEPDHEKQRLASSGERFFFTFFRLLLFSHFVNIVKLLL
jgi:hypothetical protein